MEYTKQVINYCNIYALSPECVFYSMLVAAGAGAAESYFIVFRPRVTAIKQMAGMPATLVKKNPGITMLISALRRFVGYIPPSIQVKRGRPKKGTGKDTPAALAGEESKENTGYDIDQLDYTSKDSVLQALSALSKDLRGKERADVLMKIADLQRMKQDDNQIEEIRTLYYLPLSCSRSCPFRRAYDLNNNELATE